MLEIKNAEQLKKLLNKKKGIEVLVQNGKSKCHYILQTGGAERTIYELDIEDVIFSQYKDEQAYMQFQKQFGDKIYYINEVLSIFDLSNIEKITE